MKRKDPPKNNWEKHWGKRDTVERLKFVNTSYKEVVNYLLSITDKSSKCIEIGCGSGTYALELLKQGRNCVASDISQKALDLTKLKGRHCYGLKNVPTKIVDIYKIPYKDNYFDLVFSDGVIEHLDVPTAIGELKRVTKKGGYVITKVPSGSLLYRIIYKLTSPIENRPYEMWYKSSKWKEIFERARYKNVHVDLCGSVIEGTLNRIIKNKRLKIFIPKFGKIYFLIKCQN